MAARKTSRLKMLTPNQKIFVEKYVETLNAAASYRFAYPKASENGARTAGPRLLTHVVVAREIEKRISKRAEKAEITQDKVLRELAKVAFLDVRKFFSGDGNLKNIVDLDDDAAATLASISIETLGGKSRGFVTTKKVKFHDKIRALQLVGKHIGMFKESENTPEDIAKALRELAKDLPG